MRETGTTCGDDLREVMAETAIDHFRGSFAEEDFTSGGIKKSCNFVEREKQPAHRRRFPSRFADKTPINPDKPR